MATPESDRSVGSDHNQNTHFVNMEESYAGKYSESLTIKAS